MPKRIYRIEELVAFERTMNVSLPSSYKNYLVNKGAGEFLGSRISLLEEWCQPYTPEELPGDFLSQPFPHADSWNDLSLLNPNRGWRAPYFDPLLFRGAMRISNLGCDAYDLLVLSGQERGNMWRDDRASSNKGIHPLQSRDGQRVTVADYLES